MKIKGLDLLNANVYNLMKVCVNELVVENSRAFNESNYNHVGELFVDQQFSSLSKMEQLRRLVERHFLFSRIDLVRKDNGNNLSFCTNGRELVFEDRTYTDLEKQLIKRFDRERECFLIDSLGKTQKYCFSGEEGENSYEEYEENGLKTVEFTIAYEYDEQWDVRYPEESCVFFGHVLDMITGDKELEIWTDYFEDSEGEQRVATSTIDDGEHTIVVGSVLTDLAYKAVSMHNKKNEKPAKMQIKMEGF